MTFKSYSSTISLKFPMSFNLVLIFILRESHVGLVVYNALDPESKGPDLSPVIILFGDYPQL